MSISEQLEAAPVEWDCSHCGLTRSVVVRFDENGLLPATVEPSCSGYLTCDAFGIPHPDDESCAGPDGATAWCPFDARDDYGTGDLEGVLAIKRDRRRAIPEIKALEEAAQGIVSRMWHPYRGTADGWCDGCPGNVFGGAHNEFCLIKPLLAALAPEQPKEERNDG